MTVPAILLILQTLFNNFLIWFFIWGLVFAYSIIVIGGIIFKIIHRSIDTVKPNVWDTKEVIILISIFLILFFINWIIFKFNPKR